MTKKNCKTNTPINQANILTLPIPSWRFKLAKLYREGHKEFHAICGFVSISARRHKETMPPWDELMKDIRILEGAGDSGSMELAIEFIDEQYSDVYRNEEMRRLHD